MEAGFLCIIVDARERVCVLYLDKSNSSEDFADDADSSDAARLRQWLAPGLA